MDNEEVPAREQDGEPGDEGSGTSRFPELDELQRDIERRIRDNQRFLDRFLNDDFKDEEGDEEEPGDDAEEEL